MQSRLAQVRRALAGERFTRRLWLFAFALSLPTMGLGHVLDDLQQQTMLRGSYDSAARSGGELYCFSLGPGEGLDASLLSWWDYEDSGLCFLRPLSSWTLWFDHAFLWELPALTHLHSLLWLMVLWFGWRRILLRSLPRDIANLALLLVAASGFISLSTGWIAARHVLVGGSLTVWGLHHGWMGRDRRRLAQEWLGLGLLALALISSEMALGAFGFLLAREWFTRAPGRWLRLSGFVVAGLAYVGVHSALGYGAPKYPLYLDPFGDPATFVRAAPERLLGLTGELVLGLPSEFWLYPTLRPLVGAVSVLSGCLLAVAVARVWHTLPDELRQALRWLGVGSLLSLAPCISGMQGGRSLTVAGFPLMAVIATCLLRWPFDEASAASTGLSRFGALPFYGLLFGALIGNPVVHVGWWAVVDRLEEAGEAGLDTDTVRCSAGSDVYLIDASQVGASAWYARYWMVDRFEARNFRQLTMIPTGIAAIELLRTGPASMILRAEDGPLVGPMAVPRGSEGRLQPGFARRYPDYWIEVKRTSDLGPTEVSYGFSHPLDSPELCVFVHDDERLYQIEPPPVGQTLRIEPAPTMSFVGMD